MYFGKTIERFSLAALFLMIAGAGSVFGQANEVGLSLGGAVTPTRDLQTTTAGRAEIGTGLTYIATYGRRIVNGEKAALIGEFVFTATPQSEVQSSNLTLPRDFASLFITPGVKLKLFPNSVLSPYAVAGGGYARFTGSQLRLNGQPNPGKQSVNTGAFNYGGGLEIRIFKFLALRGEVRDFITGNPDFNAPAADSIQHNVLPSGGIVFRF